MVGLKSGSPDTKFVAKTLFKKYQVMGMDKNE